MDTQWRPITTGATIVFFALGAIQGFIAFWQIRAVRRLSRELDLAAEYNSILAWLATQSFMLCHGPIFAAWTATMGDMRVQIQTARKTIEWEIK